MSDLSAQIMVDLLTCISPDAPTQTTLTSPQDGHSPGDVAIYLSEDLASRVTEMIERSQQCAAGDAFPTTKSFRTRELENRYGAIICAAQQVVLNASPGAPFAELALLQGKQSSWSSPILMQAMGEVIGFAVKQARFMKLSDEAATHLGFYSFMLAYTVINNKKPLSRVNWILGNDLKGSMTESPTHTTITVAPTTTTSPASSSSLFECSASCTMVGPLKRCSTQCPTGTGEITKPTIYAVRTVTVEPWVVPVQVPMQEPVAMCLPGNDTDFPTDLFTQTYSEFCKQADETKDGITWIVNTQGEQIQPKSRRVQPRDESSAGQYDEYSFVLGWRLQDDEVECSRSCGDAFKDLASSDSCKRGSTKSNMAASGGITIGCGTYSFTIESKPKPVESSIKCRNHPLSAPKHDSNANGATSIESAARNWCQDNDGHMINRTPGTDNIFWRWGITQLDVPNRSSFWLRANVNGVNKEGKFVKDECIAAITDGLSKCDSNSDISHGFTASVGSMDYSVDLSGVTQDGNPPWAEKPAFPAPEFVPGKDLGGFAHSPACYAPEDSVGRKLSEGDLASAVDAFCVDGADIKGFGKYWDAMVQYPPKGQPQFYNSDALKMHLLLGAETINNGAKQPYDDMDWCK